MTLFLAGDVMTGRGVDQILAHPLPPRLHEPYVRDAREYVRLAEGVSGAVPRGADPAYPWGDALAVWDSIAPTLRIVNLETSITRRDDHDSRKSVHYRMNPANAACLTAARCDICVLANNHVLDYGREGLAETLDTLARAGITAAGAGRDEEEAMRPAIAALEDGRRAIVAACAHEDSGVPRDWAARGGRSGIHLLPDLSESTAEAVAVRVSALKHEGDVAVVSIHWGDNWGYDVPLAHAAFAHRLVDRGVDVVHGHSSHHPRPIEVYRHSLILYGCGDFLNDYEGIPGYEQYRGDLVLMYFPSFDPASARLSALRMIPMRISALRLRRAGMEDARWICDTLQRISEPLNARLTVSGDGSLELVPA